MAITKATASSVAPAAKGDLVVGSATNDAAVLGVGSNDQVLTADSSTTTGLKWAAASSGGMTLLETLSFSGASVTSSSISQSYKNLQIIVRNFKPASEVALRMRFNADTGTSYRSPENFADDGNTAGSTVMAVGQDQDNATATGLVIINIPDYTNSTTWKFAQMYAITNFITNPSTTMGNRMPTGIWFNTNAITTVTFLPASGNFTSGEALIYGVK